MQIIKDKQFADDSWQFIEDEDDAELGDGNITVSANRLKASGTQLAARTGPLGLRLLPGETLDGIIEHLPKLSLVELYFPDMNDGRLFSLAWLLRNRHGYQGEIRASGHFLPEQVFYLSRVGVNSFNPEKPESLPVTLANLQDFSVNYQPSVN